MIQIKQLDNGVRIATDRMKNVRSCAMGFWLEVGSRHEEPAEAGLTHFIEHMLFKGTPRYDALRLSDELNRIGGNVNAHTGQEALCLHARCVDSKVPAALDLMSEMLLDSTFPEEEIGRERNVILEEHKMYEDNPEEQVFDMFFEALWPGSPLGRPIIGEPRTIRKFGVKGIRQYLGRVFDPSRILVVLAGSFDQKACEETLRKRFGALPGRRRAAQPGSPTVGPSGSRLRHERDIEQVHFCFGSGGPSRGSKERYAFGLMNMIMGGGMSSRLFREVREKRGLVYNIQSFAQAFRGAGAFGIAGSTSLKTLHEVLQLSMEELRRIRMEPPSTDELELAREQVIDSILMSVESTSSRMMHLSESIMAHGRYLDAEEIVDAVRKVRPGDIRRVAEKYLTEKPIASVLIGPKGFKRTRGLPV